MKPNFGTRQTGLTLIEVILAIAVLVVLALTLLVSVVSGLREVRKKEFNWECTHNLEYIGVAYRMWAQDHQGHFPASETVSDGGWSELLTNADQGSNCWKYYGMMAQYLTTPKGLFCPFDERLRAPDFITNGLPQNPYFNYFQDNATLSFFIGASANADAPNSILAGDRNLGFGAKPDADYGFSPKNNSGNDVAIPISGPISWSMKMHSAGNLGGVGNILLSDGSVQQVSTANVNGHWLRNAPPTTNWPVGHVPSSPSIRLIFP